MRFLDAPGPEFRPGAGEGQSDSAELADYLRAGHVLFASMGGVEDVLGSGEFVLGGGSLLTDGEWVWRGVLWFYVERYRFPLPEAFVAQVRAAGYRVPAVDAERLRVLAG
ncbi:MULTISPECIES: hypothetical protein [Streptomyces]|uniref:Immunity protein 35 domain-containing protein n=1 Tax=Streptomyces luteosporeus TaxID=173856 RepID=A0ABP6G6Y4_9ACTN